MVNAPSLSLRGGRRPTWRPEREARGSALGVQSRSTQPDNRVLPANTAALRDGASRTPPPTRRVRSAGIPGNLQLPKALTERRYRRNRLVRFYRHLVRTGSAFPRLHPKGTSSRCALRAPRPRWGLIMTHQGAWRGERCGASIRPSDCRSADGRGMPRPYNGLPQNTKNPPAHAGGLAVLSYREPSRATNSVSRTNTAATHFVRRESFASSVPALPLPR